MNPPIQYFGGKTRLSKYIVELFPPHQEYIEPFFGSGAVFFRKAPAPIETVNDIDGTVVNFFRVLRDQPEQLLKLCRLTPYSREQFFECRDRMDAETDPVRRAWQFFIVARMSFSGKMKDFSFDVNKRRHIAPFLNTIERLPEVSERLRNTQIENKDALSVINTYTTPNSLIYCDPPYIDEGQQYRKDYTDAQHLALLEKLIEVDCSVVVSCYEHPAYAVLADFGFQKKTFDVQCSSGAVTNSKTKPKSYGTARRIEVVYYKIKHRRIK